MDNIALHMRISSVKVTDDEVKSRSAAATTLSTKWGKEKNISSILEKAASVAQALGNDGTSSAELEEEVQAAIRKKSPAYVAEESPLEIGVCAGMAMSILLKSSPNNSGWLVSDVYAFALWSAIAFQPALQAHRRETLRREILETATKRATSSTEQSRRRVTVPNVSKLEITIGEGNVTTNNFEESILNTIDALRRNAALDREEIDFLWWTQLGHSRLLQRKFSDIAEPTRIVATGIEGANMLRRLPCEVHRELVLRTVDKNEELDLTELLKILGDDRTVLGEPFNHAYVTANPTILPLLYALTTTEPDELSELGCNVKRSVTEWGERALLEAGLFNMMYYGPGKL